MTAILPPWTSTCPHVPPCPPAEAVDHDAAVAVSHDWTTGVSRLCNGVLLFADGGELVPDESPCGCHAEGPHRGPAPHCTNPEHGHPCPCETKEN